MGKLTLPESVKTCRTGIETTTSKTGSPFPMTLGTDEIAILLSFYYWWRGVVAAGNNVINIGLWRKTDTDSPSAGLTIDHTDMVWNLCENINFVTESVKQSGKEHVILPYPLVLIRAPRLEAYRSTFTAVAVEMRLFYFIEKVTDEELAKLMVKDHA